MPVSSTLLIHHCWKSAGALCEMTQSLGTWKTRDALGNEYGPFTDDDVGRYIQEYRISADTEVQHARVTKGKWVRAASVTELYSRIKNVSPPVPPSLTAAASPPTPRFNLAPRETSRVVRSKPSLAIPVCIVFEVMATLWILLFVVGFAGGVEGGLINYFSISGNLTSAMQIASSSFEANLMRVVPSFLDHAKYSVFLIFASQVLRILDRIRRQA